MMKRAGADVADHCRQRAGALPLDPPTSRRASTVGLSLIELLVVLAVASLLFSIALPSMEQLLRAQALRAASSQWIASLQRARAEALRSGSAVDILPIDSSQWHRGWNLARDVNRNRAFDGDDELLYAYGPLSSGLTTTFNFAGRPLRYQPNGRPLQSGHLLLTMGSMRRKVIVSMLGRPRVCDPDQSRNC